MKKKDQEEKVFNLAKKCCDYIKSSYPKREEIIVFDDFEITDILFNLSSVTATIPILGSIVQKGKFSA